MVVNFATKISNPLKSFIKELFFELHHSGQNNQNNIFFHLLIALKYFHQLILPICQYDK